MGNKTYIRTFQKGFNYSQDGPGNRLVYHLSGCNLKCPWCSNPEGLRITDGTAETDIDDIVKEVLGARMMFIDGGGVTLTGGEVTCQKEAVLTLLKKLKENNINTCIETNVSVPDCEEIFDTVDYMIADFKSPDGNALASVVGADISVIKSNLLYRAETGKPLLVRVPLVHFFNCGEKNAREFGEFFSEINRKGNGNVSFEILTYHEYGKEKYAKLGMEYTVTDGDVSESDVRLLLSELKNKNLKIINT